MPTLLTSDGTRIHALHRPRRPPSPAGARSPDEPSVLDVAVVLGHGFTGSLERRDVRAVVDWLADEVGVVAIDFRGHGRSTGVSTVGSLEVEDVEAAVRWARVLGYRRVATVGFSMGGAVVLRHGGLHGGVDAVVSVSAPAWWHYRGTVPMRRLLWLIESGSGRAVSRVWRRTRIDRAGWPDPMPVPPSEAASTIGVPLLVVHGDRDPFFPVEHAQTIFDTAAEPKELWLRPGLGHAEGSVDRDLVREIARWVRANVDVAVAR